MFILKMTYGVQKTGHGCRSRAVSGVRQLIQGGKRKGNILGVKSSPSQMLSGCEKLYLEDVGMRNIF